jgi:hypothetical protein
MGLEWGDGDTHPVREGQALEQTVELGFAVGPVQAEDLARGGPDRPLPDPEKVSFVHQLGCGGCLGDFTVLNLRLWSSLRNVDLELDEEFHDVLLSGVFFYEYLYKGGIRDSPSRR